MIMDTCLLVTLGVTLFYVVRLQAQLHKVKQSSQEITPSLRSLSVMMDHQMQHVKKMTQTYEDVKKKLETDVGKLTLLKDDMGFLVDHGDKLYQRIDGKLDELKTYEQSMFRSKLYEQVGERPTPIMPPLTKDPLSNAGAKVRTSDQLQPHTPSYLFHLKTMR